MGIVQCKKTAIQNAKVFTRKKELC